VKVAVIPRKHHSRPLLKALQGDIGSASISSDDYEMWKEDLSISMAKKSAGDGHIQTRKVILYYLAVVGHRKQSRFITIHYNMLQIIYSSCEARVTSAAP
jgi:hypothetical protein